MEVSNIRSNIEQETGLKDNFNICRFDERFVERFGESLSKWLGRKPNMLQECFNLSQLPRPDEGLV